MEKKTAKKQPEEKETQGGMERPLGIFPAPAALRALYERVCAYIERYNDQDLRVDIRGTFHVLGTDTTVEISDWHFLKSVGELNILELQTLDAQLEPVAGQIRYVAHCGTAELRFRLKGEPPQ